MTDDEQATRRAAYRARERERNRKRAAVRRAAMTPAEHAAELALRRERAAARTPEQRAKLADYMRHWRRNRPAEKIEQERAAGRARAARNRASWSPAQRKAKSIAARLRRLKRAELEREAARAERGEFERTLTAETLV